MQQTGLKIVVVFTTLMFVGCIGSESEAGPDLSPFNGHEWTGANPAPLFTLESMNGSLWSLEEERGNTVVLAFTYTRCYSTCPVISHSLSAAYSKLTIDEKENITFDMLYFGYYSFHFLISLYIMRRITASVMQSIALLAQ